MFTLSRLSFKSKRTSRQRHETYRPMVESLEDRLVPAEFGIANFELQQLDNRLGGAVDINELGHVTGATVDNQGPEAFIFDGAKTTRLGTLGGASSVPTALNDLGQVVGASTDSAEVERAFLFDGNDMNQLDDGGAISSRAVDINNNSEVIIRTIEDFGVARGYYYSFATGSVDMGDLGGGVTRPVAINSSGVVTGTSRVASGFSHAFRWTLAGGMVDIGPASSVADINDAGNVALTLPLDNGGPRAVFVSANGERTVLPDMGFGGGARDINNLNEVVGFVHSVTGPRAAKWRGDGTLVVAGQLDGPEAFFEAVNDNGTAVGRALDSNFNRQAIVWNEIDNSLLVLPTVQDGIGGGAVAINNSNQIAGFTRSAVGDAAALWTPGGFAGELILDIQGVITFIADLKTDGLLASGEANELTQKLEGAIEALRNDNFNTADNKLNSVLNSLDSSNIDPTVGDLIRPLVVEILTKLLE